MTAAAMGGLHRLLEQSLGTPSISIGRLDVNFGIDHQITGADVEVPDLRGGFSHLIAALTADGRSTVSNVGIIARGYENFITKLELLGADFQLEG